MNKEIAKIWCDALRSGEYKQGTGVLHDLDHNTFCCLGVLCDLAVKAGIGVTPKPAFGFNTYDNAFNMLPDSVKKWAGMFNGGGRLKSDGCTNDNALFRLNDEKKFSFVKIADFIEEHVEDL